MSNQSSKQHKSGKQTDRWQNVHTQAGMEREGENSHREFHCEMNTTYIVGDYVIDSHKL